VWDFLLLISTLALAGSTTVAEMAEAAMTEKRLKFMAVTLVFGWLACPVGLWSKLNAQGLIA
jgi:heme/copper-type cytochrome/quinol oxidase subunit 3